MVANNKNNNSLNELTLSAIQSNSQLTTTLTKKCTTFKRTILIQFNYESRSQNCVQYFTICHWK